jgi:hypothetical protein
MNGGTEERRNLHRGATEGDVGRGGASRGTAEQRGGGASEEAERPGRLGRGSGVRVSVIREGRFGQVSF